MTKNEAMQMALDALEILNGAETTEGVFVYTDQETKALRAALTQRDVPETTFGETEPVAMKFQIFKQTPPRGRELDPINSALLPWVYDQDPSSGNVASMWVTPVATLLPQRKEWVGLTKEELEEISEFHFHGAFSGRDVYEDIETRLKEKNT